MDRIKEVLPDMRKFFLLLAAAAMLAITGAAVATAAPVTINKNGYVPNSLTIAQGGTVQFTNSDAVTHQVTFKSAAGVTCTPNLLVLQPGANGSCTFQNGGSYTYSDPNVKGATFRGSITVTGAPESISLAAKPFPTIYRVTATLSGILSTQETGANVDVLAQQCGAKTATKIGTVQTMTGGAYTSTARPLMNTTYTTKAKNITSSAVTVPVRPRLRLAKVAPRRYSLRVFAARSFSGKYARFQRYNRTLRRWVAVKSVLLRPNSTGVAPTIVAAAAFRSTIKAGLRVRVTLSQVQTGSCYAAGRSNTILS